MSKRKLLLADDSETVQKVVNLTFELEGIEVITFGDGDSAMAQLSAVAPDVVLADVNMPGMTGYEICRNIKADEATKNTPVILLVGSFEPFDEQKAMQVGADDYLTKPFQSIRQLVSKVNELLSNGKDETVEEEPNFSFDETLKMETSSFRESDFGDPGMDDEMIQTSRIGSVPLDETAKFQTPAHFEDDESDVSKTQPLSAGDWQDTYSKEQASETSENTKQTVYELADEPDEMPTEITADSVSEENIPEPEEERGLAFVTEPTAEEPVSDSYDIENLDEHYPENAAENDYGIQPDDIDHFYKEPDYEDEEAVEVPIFSPQTEKVEREETPAVSQNERDLTESENISFHDTLKFPETIEPENEPITEPEPESEIKNSFSENDAPGEIKTESEDLTDISNYQTEDFNFESKTESEYLKTESETDVKNSENKVEVGNPTDSLQFLSTAPILDFDELDLLEVSFPEDRPTSFVDVPTENQTSTIEETPSVEETIEVQDENENVKSQVAGQLSGVNLSAADIDAIADKVVEKLTARLKE